MVAMGIIVTMATERAIDISQYKAAAVSYLIAGISAILRLTKLNLVQRCLFTEQSVPLVDARETLVTIATRQVIDISAV